ncbi:SET and MYND domaincontaining protein DDB_G0273589like [Caligus rogercresseyi]|uniref:SET and MYND domaincontaining protein DDB_G0273589like n=1 Tax=Caligus rogercresseyi TaxID=217165 RepID=A0A7T8KMA2_CALRO|nr:SET and MYND domaincontaining protein DDB_G0273589like [Caligus rogercresseyi]
MDCHYVSPQGFAEDTYNQVAHVVQGMENTDINPEQCSRFITIYSKILHPSMRTCWTSNIPCFIS